jgi:hypothetical protein
METPLARAQGLARALEFIGYGLQGLDEDSAPAILEVAQALADNLRVLKDAWMHAGKTR